MQEELLGSGRGLLPCVRLLRNLYVVKDRPNTEVKRASLLASFVYCAFTHVSDPVSLTATSEKKRCSGLPSAVPRWSVEIRSGPAFL